MYCVNCGVKLSDGQTICPVCHTKVYHPDFKIQENSTYPKIPFKSEEFNRKGLMFVITILFLIPVLLPVILELTWHDEIVWSGYVSGGTFVFYVCFILPCWFKRANPVIFVPTSFAVATLFLLYVCLHTGGTWFMPFAFPLCLSMTVIASAITTLLYYLKRGKLYTVGGGLISLGLWTVLLELLIRSTFNVYSVVMWSSASLTVLALAGIVLILTAIIKPLKESLRKVFFIGKIDD
ncbi:MAG: zinc ribbon domain-containing protein [Clostridiales bacterium]|nr:zinc ribbon domain-containing protein [Clostridiales bacterium]